MQLKRYQWKMRKTFETK